MIHPNAYETIRAESIRREEKAQQAGGQDWIAFSEDVQKQQAFLEHFDKTFSVSASIKVADVQYTRYSTWRGSSIFFVETFNAIIEKWHDDIYVSAATRARGKMVTGDDGTVTFVDADTQLTKAFLRTMYAEFNDKIDLNHKGGLNNTNTQLTKEQWQEVRGDMIEHDDC